MRRTEEGRARRKGRCGQRREEAGGRKERRTDGGGMSFGRKAVEQRKKT